VVILAGWHLVSDISVADIVSPPHSLLARWRVHIGGSTYLRAFAGKCNRVIENERSSMQVTHAPYLLVTGD